MKLAGWRRWVKQVAAPGEAVTGAVPERSEPAARPGPPAAVQAEALQQMSTAVTWLIGALAAVAAAMLAGSQLSSIGKLSWSQDRDRLVIAVLSISVAIGLILLAIGLLYRAQAPTNTDFTRLRQLAGPPKPKRKRLDEELLRQVTDDSTLHRGRGDLTTLMRAFDEVREQFHGLKDRCYETELEAVRATAPTERAAKQAQLARLEQEREVVGDRMTDYRIALVRVAQLDKYLRTRARNRRTAWSVMALSVLAAFAFVSFAWAANPPAKPADAVAQSIVPAHLVLTAKGQAALEPRVGRVCASAASTAGGIPVLAVSSTDAAVEVIFVPTGSCSRAHRLVISRDDGEVTADTAVLPSATPSTPR